jgi:CRP-like cAMP-binding protein
MEWTLLASLSDEERSHLLAASHHHSYRRGDVVVHEGAPADSLHLVESGRLAVRVTTAAGDSATLNILGPGDYFGELALLDPHHPTRSATVFAMEQATTRSLSVSAFAELRRNHRAADYLLLALMARRIELLSERLLEAMYDGLDRRVHRRLLELVRTYADGSQGPVTVSVTQELLAELVGGTRPSVNQVLQRLVREGCVELGRGRITVLEPARLLRRVG